VELQGAPLPDMLFLVYVERRTRGGPATVSVGWSGPLGGLAGPGWERNRRESWAPAGLRLGVRVRERWAAELAS
jgi:hypothetical protein